MSSSGRGDTGLMALGILGTIYGTAELVTAIKLIDEVSIFPTKDLLIASLYLLASWAAMAGASWVVLGGVALKVVSLAIQHQNGEYDEQRSELFYNLLMCFLVALMALMSLVSTRTYSDKDGEC